MTAHSGFWFILSLLSLSLYTTIVASQDSAQSSSTAAVQSTRTGTSSNATPTTPPDRTIINPTIDPATDKVITTATDSKGISYIVVVETQTPLYQLFPSDIITKTYDIPNVPSPIVDLYDPLDENDVKILKSYVISNLGGIINPTEGTFIPTSCWYPISGNYGRLPRILFYVVIVAALVLRDFQWLYAGALVAALTYSGSAAVHAALLVWKGPGWGELDVLPLFAILSTSCIIAVPLINWSATLRHIGEDKISKEREEFDAGARAVTFVWAFVVAVGFLCIFVVLLELSFIQDMNKHTTKWSLMTPPSSNSTICTPESGLIDTNAGQLAIMDRFWLTSEFIDANRCLDPCTNPRDEDRPIFRKGESPTLIPGKTVDHLLGKYSTNQKVAKRVAFADGYLSYAIFSLPYIILQGVWAMAVGRRSPAEARNHLYVKIAWTAGLELDDDNRLKRKPTPGFRLFMAKWIALMGYTWAVFIMLVCVPILIINLISAEIMIYEFPQAEENDHIGAWTPWVSTGLVLIAAFIVKFHHPALIRLLAFFAETTSRGGRAGKKAKEVVFASNRANQDGLEKITPNPEKQPGVLRSTIRLSWNKFWSSSWKFAKTNVQRSWGKFYDELVGFKTFLHDPINEEWVFKRQGHRWQLGLDGNTQTTNSNNTLSGQPGPQASAQASNAPVPSSGNSPTSRLLDPNSSNLIPAPLNPVRAPSNPIPSTTNAIPRKPVSANQQRETLQVDDQANQGPWRASFARTSRSNRKLRRSELYGDGGAFGLDKTPEQSNEPEAATALLRPPTSERPPTLSVSSFGPPFGGSNKPGQTGADWPVHTPRSGKNRSATSSKPPTPPPK